MFGLFGKSDKNKVKVIDKVWMSKEAKYAASQQMFNIDKRMLFLVWFENTKRELLSALTLKNQNETVKLVSEVNSDELSNRIVVFAEHYPLCTVEQKQFQRLMLNEVNVLMSMDEPFLAKFGGDRMIEVMKKMGMNENEVIGHSMINRSIRNAQEKLEKNIKSEKSASSQAEWFQFNVKS